jgi:hypothetical protein
MLKLATDNVISLLASLGFEDTGVGDRNEIVIDNFDQWINPDSDSATATFCSFDIDEPVEAAA